MFCLRNSAMRQRSSAPFQMRMMMQVYLVERLDADREDQLLHMKVCIRMKPMQRPAARC